MISFLIHFWQEYFINDTVYFILHHIRKHRMLDSGVRFDHLVMVATARYFLWKAFSLAFRNNLWGNVV